MPYLILTARGYIVLGVHIFIHMYDLSCFHSCFLGICKNFSKFSNFNMSCYEYFGGPKISCDGLLLERAIVIPRCQQKFHPDIKVNYDYATCREDGSWDKPFFKCVPGNYSLDSM